MTDPALVLVDVGPAVEEAAGVWRAPPPPAGLLITTTADPDDPDQETP